MTFDLPRTAAALLLAGAWTALTFGTALAPAPLAAATDATRYTAELAAPASESRLVAGKTLWKCSGTTCVTQATGSRPGRLCRDLQRKAGTVTQFTMAGEALNAETLARCNK